MLTYKKVAELADIKNPRVVGFALHANKSPIEMPCHRVVRSDGYLSGYAFGGIDKKRKLLIQEGVSFASKYTVDLGKSLLR